MKKPSPLVLAGLALAGLAGLGVAQIKAYTLSEMVQEADGAVHGTIVSRQAFRVDDPEDGPELYFTTLTLEGTDLSSGTAVTLDVTYNGGFVSPDEGVWNSEAPSADDVQIGNEVVVFYAWSNNMGGRVSGNSLLASHGGLYRTVKSGQQTVVLGRGKGYAIQNNLSVGDLSSAIRNIEKTRRVR